MCGLAGLVHWNPDVLRRDLSKMNHAIVHRGPDAEGYWTTTDQSIGLAHRRLSILDLSVMGHQPMTSKSGKFTLAFNGEIYNYTELSEQLGLPPDDVHGDTRVLIEAFDRWGVEETLKKLNGMYAIALWDEVEQQMTLARDPIGIKPLYYSIQHNGVAFASELSALSALDLPRRISRVALGQLIRSSVVPSPLSIYEDTLKCPPGHLVTISKEGRASSPQPFLTVQDLADAGRQNPFTGSWDEAVEILDQALRRSVQLHMASDVPLGSFLSGGIDSSLISAIAQDLSPSQLQTFTIGFDDPRYNEAIHAKAIAKHLGTEHHEFIVQPSTLLERVPLVLDHCDEPFADSSQLPTSLVSELTRRSVTVALSGDGGDELFCGYARYRWSESLWRRIKTCPPWSRAPLGTLLRTLSPQTWDQLLKPFEKLDLLPEAQMGQKLHQLASMIHAKDEGQLYRLLMTHLQDPSVIVKDAAHANLPMDDDKLWHRYPDLRERMMLMDSTTYLPDDILTKVDRSSMQFSLEARVPLLTPELVQLAWSFPLAWRQNKKLLKAVLDRYVPTALTQRPKMGFGVPIGSALRGVLKPWADELLNDKQLQQGDFFHGPAIQKLWRQHLEGRHQHDYLLWNILVFQHWNRRQT